MIDSKVVAGVLTEEETKGVVSAMITVARCVFKTRI